MPAAICIFRRQGTGERCPRRGYVFSILQERQGGSADFSYKLVGIRDYGSEELLDKADEMSLIMLLNKIQTAEDLHRVLDMPADAVNRIVSKSPGHVLDIILDVVYLLCRKVNLSSDETHEMLSQLKEGRNMGYLFENMEHMDIQEERRKTREAREELEKFREKARAELAQAEEELRGKQAELAAALEELEQYRTAERERNKA